MEPGRDTPSIPAPNRWFVEKTAQRCFSALSCAPMKVVAGRSALAASRDASRASAYVIGNFDGVHLGHRALLRTAGERAAAGGGEVSVGGGGERYVRVLASEGAALGMAVTVVPPVTVSGLTCSSTKVREFALEGRVEGAAMLLGRPLEVTGTVVHGAGRGRGLGVPTANLRPEAELLPRPGIYAGRALLLDSAGGAPAAAHVCALSIGSNPTFTAGAGT